MTDFDKKFSAFEQWFRSNLTKKDDISRSKLTDIADLIVAEMVARNATSFDGHEPFFARLFDSGALPCILERGFGNKAHSVSQQYLLLLTYLDYKSNGQSTLSPGHVPAKFPLDEWSSEQQFTALAIQLGTLPNVSIAFLEGLVDALIDKARFDKKKAYHPGAHSGADKSELSEPSNWTPDGLWKTFATTVDDLQKSFDLAHFLFVVLANLPSDDKEQALYKEQSEIYKKEQKKVDGETRYLALWQYIREKKTKTGDPFRASAISDVAKTLFRDRQLAYVRNRTKDANEGLFATALRLTERRRFMDALKMLLDDRALQVAAVSIGQGKRRDDADVLAAMMQAYNQADALVRWCDLVDAATGRLGEGATRARAFFSQQRNFGALQWSLYCGLDMETPTTCRWQFAALSNTRNAQLIELGQGDLKILLCAQPSLEAPVPFAQQVLSEEQSFTVRLLKRLPQMAPVEFDNILRCLYYARTSAVDLPHPNGEFQPNGLTKPLYVLLKSLSQPHADAARVANFAHQMANDFNPVVKTFIAALEPGWPTAPAQTEAPIVHTEPLFRAEPSDAPPRDAPPHDATLDAALPKKANKAADVNKPVEQAAVKKDLRARFRTYDDAKSIGEDDDVDDKKPKESKGKKRRLSLYVTTKDNDAAIGEDDDVDDKKPTKTKAIGKDDDVDDKKPTKTKGKKRCLSLFGTTKDNDAADNDQEEEDNDQEDNDQEEEEDNDQEDNDQEDDADDAKGGDDNADDDEPRRAKSAAKNDKSNSKKRKSRSNVQDDDSGRDKETDFGDQTLDERQRALAATMDDEQCEALLTSIHGIFIVTGNKRRVMVIRYYDNVIRSMAVCDDIVDDPITTHKELMLFDDNLVTSYYAWRTMREFLALQTHLAKDERDITWQFVWSMPYEIAWPVQHSYAPREKEFESRRLEFVRRNAIAFWKIDGTDQYLVHMRSLFDIAKPEFTYLFYGFLTVLATEQVTHYFEQEAPALQNQDQEERKEALILQKKNHKDKEEESIFVRKGLLTEEEKAQHYPWRTGAEGWALIQANCHIKSKTVMDLMSEQQQQQRPTTAKPKRNIGETVVGDVPQGNNAKRRRGNVAKQAQLSTDAADAEDNAAEPESAQQLSAAPKQDAVPSAATKQKETAAPLIVPSKADDVMPPRIDAAFVKHLIALNELDGGEITAPLLFEMAQEGGVAQPVSLRLLRSKSEPGQVQPLPWRWMTEKEFNYYFEDALFWTSYVLAGRIAISGSKPQDAPREFQEYTRVQGIKKLEEFEKMKF